MVAEREGETSDLIHAFRVLDTPRCTYGSLFSSLLPYLRASAAAAATHLHILNGHLILRSVGLAACSTHTHDSNTCDSLHSNNHRIATKEEEEEEVVSDANKSPNYYFTATC